MWILVDSRGLEVGRSQSVVVRVCELSMDREEHRNRRYRDQCASLPHLLVASVGVECGVVWRRCGLVVWFGLVVYGSE